MNATLRLFRAITIAEKGKKKSPKSVLVESIKRGFVFSPEVVYNYSEGELLNFISMIDKEIGLTPEQMNSSFHKSWKKVTEADIEQLFMEQIVHYITTYGFESLGIYDENSVYIPTEKLTIPKIDVDKIQLVVIKGYTKEELKEKLLKLLSSGIALKEDTKKDVIDVATFVEIESTEIDQVKNKEVRVALYDYFNMFPENPIEFLRYAIYKSTNRTLLIKDKITIADIKSKDNLSVLGLLVKYEKQYGLERLAEIFYRFKPLWLGFRTNQKLKGIINNIRRLAVKHHKPMQEDYLNTVTARIKNLTISEKTLKEELGKAGIFRKIRLAYALGYRMNKD